MSNKIKYYRGTRWSRKLLILLLHLCFNKTKDIKYNENLNAITVKSSFTLPVAQGKCSGCNGMKNGVGIGQ